MSPDAESTDTLQPLDAVQPLREDIHLLGDLLGETLKAQEGAALFELVEQTRARSKSDFDELTALVASLPASDALPVARAFAHFLNLANIAEQHHRIRRRRTYECDANAKPQSASFEEAFARLRGDERLFETVAKLRVELVLTAHPTEVLRRTLLQKNRRIAELLAERDHRDLTLPEKRRILDDLRREITSMWETDEVRHERPTPLDEVKGGLFIFEQTLWDALPRSMRALDEALRRHTGRPLPLDATPIRFGSWIGGDRDGNPNVTAAVTKKACLLSRWMAADLHLRGIEALRADLSMATGSPELASAAGCTREPYRALLRGLRDRLAETRTSIEDALQDAVNDRGGALLLEAREVIEPLLLCWHSLHETGNAVIAEGRLLDCIRQAYCFGTTLVRLDVRQDAAKHTALLDALTGGRYAKWSEEERQSYLIGELQSPLPDGDFGDDLETFRAIEELPPESLGAYVITMASQPSDVLAAARFCRKMRIVPLFETLDDLRGAGAAMRALLAIDAYRERIDGRQEVMIGYSDSSKDAGRLAAAWALYEAQEAIVAACAEAGVEATLFHGRGGSVGRGGGPTYLAVRSQPPGSVDGRLRVTVQGEMIQAEFGLPDIALRTLEVYTTATLDATLDPLSAPRAEWRARMQRMAEEGARSYREVVYETPRFVEYFRTATPEPELAQINIGSRPARRGAQGGVESLRAIPWQFAWTQNRLLLPSWLGFDDALALDDARELMEWPFFRSTVELIEMVLAKTEPRIAAYYDRVLVPADLQPFGEELRARLARTIESILKLTGHERLLETNRVLRRSIEVRNPYVDPINVVQAEVLRRLREHDDTALRDAFVVTVNGIAAGMRNTG